MKSYTVGELRKALSEIGLRRGDVIYLHSRLFALGLLEDASSKEAMCAAIFGAIREVLGPEGTLVVPTFTTQTARLGEPYVHEETPCMTGVFCEYLRHLPEAVRSLHPINSVCAWGERAHDICDDVGRGNYGLDSPYDRMRQIGAKAVNLGLARCSNSWHHSLETQYGVPYLYNKLLNIDVFKAGRLVEGPFFASLRYLDFEIHYDASRFDQVLMDEGLIRIETVGSGIATCISVEDYWRVGLKLLKRNPYYFLRTVPNFRHGEIPFDGIVEGARAVRSERRQGSI